MNRFHRAILSGAVAMLGVASLALADTGTLVVKTVDSKSSPFPGVAVQIENTKGLTAPQAKQTDGTGTATFLLPPGGGYKVTVQLGGYNTIETADIKMELNKTKTVLYTMQEMLKEVVQVKGGKVVDLEDDTGKTTFSDSFVEDLPVLGHSYQNVLTLAPGVNDADSDGNPNVHGGRERDFHMAVDGVSNVDPLTGTFMSNINPDAIEEIEVVATGASAEFGRGQSFGKIITKQGGNSFETVASIYLRSSLLDGNTNQPEGGEEVQYHDVRPALNLTGPVIKDKVFFALFHEYRDVGRPVNFAAGGGIVVKTKGSLNTDKLTWQASPRNKLIFQAQADPIRTGPLGVDAFTDPQSGVDRKQGGPTYQLRWNAQVSSVLNLESLVAVSHTGIDLIPVTDKIKNTCVRDANAFGRLDPYGRPGGQPIDEDYCFQDRNATTSGSYFDNHTDDRIRYTVRSDATYFMENFLGVSHTFKGGVLVEKERFRSTDIVRSFLNFSEALRPQGSGTDSPVTTGGGFLARTVYVPGYPEGEQNRADSMAYGFYFEDQFRPHQNVSIRAGIRIERESVQSPGFGPFDPQQEFNQYDTRYTACVAASPNPNATVRDRCARSAFRSFHTYENFPTVGNSPLKPIITDPSAQLQDRTPEEFNISNTNIGPRFSISWDPKGDSKTKLFATAGRVYDKTFLGVAIAEQGPDSFDFRYNAVPIQENCHVNNQGNFVCDNVRVVTQTDGQSQVSPASINQIDRNLRTPYVDEYTAGLSREIAPETSINLTYVRRQFRDQFQDVDINHRTQDLGRGRNCTAPGPNTPSVPVDNRPDGRPDDCGGGVIPIANPGGGPFDPPIKLQVPDGIADSYLYNPFFNRVLRVGNFNTTDYEAWTLELVRRLHRNWQMEASYVWSKAVGQAEDYVSAVGNDPTSKQDEFGFLDFDQRHVLKVNITTQIPLWNVRIGSAFSWASGQPYSIRQRGITEDQPVTFGNFGIGYSTARTSYPTHTRNDQRNDGYWLFNVNAKKDFTVGKANIETSLEIFNLFNNKYLVVDQVLNRRALADQHIGRQLQLGAKFSF